MGDNLLGVLHQKPDVTRMMSHFNAMIVSVNGNKEIDFNKIESSDLIIFLIYQIGIAFSRSSF